MSIIEERVGSRLFPLHQRENSLNLLWYTDLIEPRTALEDNSAAHLERPDFRSSCSIEAKLPAGKHLGPDEEPDLCVGIADLSGNLIRIWYSNHRMLGNQCLLGQNSAVSLHGSFNIFANTLGIKAIGG